MAQWSGIQISNCILWGDFPDEIANSDGDPIVTCSDVQYGYPNMGNIDIDPQFVFYHGFEYFLGRSSPCIDAGDPAVEDSFEWPEWYSNGPASDMGAFGGSGNANWFQ